MNRLTSWTTEAEILDLKLNILDAEDMRYLSILTDAELVTNRPLNYDSVVTHLIAV